jgi:pyridoxal phosphate enzyme (YggS family)
MLLRIGPSIGPCCYSIGQDVIFKVPRSAILKAFSYSGMALTSRPLASECDATLGLGVEQIEIAQMHRRPLDDFYSWRENKHTGRFGALISVGIRTCSPTSMIDLENNLRVVQQRIADAASRSKRDLNDIRLIAVTKTFPPEIIVAAYDLGVHDFGENRVEEAFGKIPAVGDRSPKVTWHMIGHLQSRKVKDAVPLFDYIHSVDSVELAERIDRGCESPRKTIPILLEVNISGEERKYGFRPEPRDGFFGSVATILELEHIDTQGLMTIAPIVSTPDQVRPFFRHLRVLR